MMLADTGSYATVMDYERCSAVSDAALGVTKSLSEINRRQEGTQFWFGRQSEAQSELRMVLEGLVLDDEQEAVKFDTEQNVMRMVRALPNDLPLPEMGIDPDGEISLDWMCSRTRMFSISVSGSDRLACAWVNGSDHGHTVVRLGGQIFAQDVVIAASRDRWRCHPLPSACLRLLAMTKISPASSRRAITFPEMLCAPVRFCQAPRTGLLWCHDMGGNPLIDSKSWGVPQRATARYMAQRFSKPMMRGAPS